MSTTTPPSSPSTPEQQQQRIRKSSLAVAGRKEIGDFWIGKVLGEGAFARVFAARLKDSNKDYAIKVMEKKFIVKEGKAKEVQMERRVLSEVDHVNVVRLYYSFHDKDHLYMVLDLCPGGELARVIRHRKNETQNRALCEKDAQFYFKETALGVQYLHSLGVIHRDIKPENVLLTNTGHVKLTDFGTAKDANTKQEMGDDGRPRKDTFCGTAEYVSPEVLQDGVADVGADLWALGCMLFAMLVGRTPFVAESEYLTFQRILGYSGAEREADDPEPEFTIIDFPPGPVALSETVLDFIRKLLAPKPKERLAYNSPQELWNHEWLKSASNNDTPPTLPYHVELETPTLDGAKNDWLLLDEGSDDLLDEFSSRQSLSPKHLSMASNVSIASTGSGGSQKPINLHEVLKVNEKAILDGVVATSSHGGLVTRRRHLVLTDKGRLLVLEPSTSSLKAEVPLVGSSVTVRPNGKEFVITLAKGARAFRFKDSITPRGGERWKEELDKFC